ncbi:MAG: biopolymer transporter ExbD [Saprospiraceae bacterium]|nr:biopolymer transporter ExbD [Saprospiraceae bacterium]
MPKRDLPEVNAGSMADIAFIMLIFFLVSTTLATDKGIRLSLPPIPDVPPESIPTNERNVLAVDIREDGSLSVEGLDYQPQDLPDEVIKFLLNNGKDPLYSDSYEVSKILIRTHPDAPYEDYIEVYSNVKSAFTKLRDQYAEKNFGKTMDEFSDTEQDRADAKAVRKKYPLKIFEAEPKEE